MRNADSDLREGTSDRAIMRHDDRSVPMNDRKIYVTVADSVGGHNRTAQVGTWQSLWSEGITIGRSPSCTIVIDSDEVSPFHSKVIGRGHHLVVEAIQGSVWFGPHEVPSGRFTRINGLGTAPGPHRIGSFTISISLVQPYSGSERRIPWWKFWLAR